MSEHIIISTRIRLARNVEGYPFPHKLGEIPARKIIDDVTHALTPVDRFLRYDIKGMGALEGGILREKHLISPDLLEESPFGAVLISSDENVSVMVNEEDHIREQVILPGLSLDQAYDRINRLDDVLAKNIRFAYSRQFGYLTSCATNLGTGMRASVMMFLPALTVKNMLESTVNDVGRLNMTVRGVYGEGSKADGYLYQISNQRTLGVKESEIIDSVRSAINHIADSELKARRLLLRDEAELKNKIYRAWGLATNAYSMPTDEAMHLLALIRLGDHYGYININDQQQFQALITHCQPANLQYICGKAMSPEERDIFRARYLSANLLSLATRASR